MSEKEKKEKPGPVNIEKIKPPTPPPVAPPAMPQGQDFANLPHQVEIELTNGKIIEFTINNGEQAMRFADSYHATIEGNAKTFRANIANVMHVIPSERIVDVRVIRPIPRVGPQ